VAEVRSVSTTENVLSARSAGEAKSASTTGHVLGA
jgi:hypothetical protein